MILLHTKMGDPEASTCVEITEEMFSEIEVEAFFHNLYHTLRLFQIRPHLHWGLSVRAANVLKKNGLLTLWDVLKVTPDDVFRLKGCGVRGMLEIYTTGRNQGVDLPNWLEAVNKQYRSTYPKV